MGIDPDILWKLTFPEYVAYITEHNKQKRRDERDRMTMAYLQAGWSRMDATDIPKLDELLGEDPDATSPEAVKAREQTPDEMADILKTLAVRTTGKSPTPRASKAMGRNRRR